MIKRRYVLALPGAVAAAGTLAACGGDDNGGSGGSGGGGGGDSVEVFTWWAQGSEKAGLDALVEVFNEQHPDVEFVNGAVAGGAGSAAKDMLQSRLQAGDPPDTFQAHAGAELNDYIDAGQITDVANLFDEFGLRDAFPDSLVERLTVDDAIYSIPSNIHRSNVVWGSTKALTDAGIDTATPPASLDEFLEQLETLKSAGVTALSVGTTWTQVNLLEAVLMAELGAEVYSGLFDGSTGWDTPEVTAGLQKFEQMMSYTNTDRDGLDWPDATQQIIDGTAAYNVMGDWAVAAFEQAEQALGDDFVAFELPGKEKIFGFLADSFTLPEGAPHPDGAKAWLETIASTDGQLAFNLAKGSIPARTDVDTAEFSEYAQTAVTSFAEDAICSSIAHGAATSVAWLNAIADATSQFTTGATDLAGYQEALKAAADANQG
ncbi:ABC transporter substrate-binding protein [Brachybacterium muris]|uniref:Probable sugar-binding periplasmic protein n=1 Tax=Brachybacterium muris UCD-AY4 TaxID=1249481 RepID=A0A022KYU3_9MICO|nr:extracellular solute-binding protein [Brachybacterium muris]EYT51014.1 sugar ABC transporter substrate-binding protein [Brachybacterium muris UCD-AY4]